VIVKRAEAHIGAAGDVLDGGGIKALGCDDDVRRIDQLGPGAFA
jgi:hypothetical protein